MGWEARLRAIVKPRVMPVYTGSKSALPLTERRMKLSDETRLRGNARSRRRKARRWVPR